MVDDLSTRRLPDFAKINLHKPEEIRYWTKLLQVTERQLRDAVAAVGVQVKEVRRYLGK